MILLKDPPPKTLGGEYEGQAAGNFTSDKNSGFTMWR